MASSIASAGAGWRAAAIAAWLAGTGWQLRQPLALPLAPARGLVLAAALVVLIAWWAARRADADADANADAGADARAVAPRGPWAAVAMRALACLAVALGGFGLASWHAALRLADRLDPALEGQPLEITGRVAEMPVWREDGARFVFAVDDARWQGQDARARVPSRVWLAWSRPQRDDPAVSNGPPALRPGQRWRLRVRLRLPHGAMNPEGFDAELWLFEQGLRATGGVDGPGLPDGPDEGAWIERARQVVRDRLLLHGDDPLAAGVLAALAVGDQAAVDAAGWSVFRDTGVSHLMSISGLHITMLAWLGGAAFAALWRRSPRAMHSLPAPVAGRWAGVVVALLYALLAGWGVPAQRTGVMLAATAALRSLARDWPAPLLAAAAAVPVTAMDPWSLLQPGFWLSFAAVALLLVSDPAHAPHAPSRDRPDGAWPRLRHAVSDGLRAQVVATLGLLPLTLVAFGQVPLVGFPANLVAVPWVTAVVTPLALAGVVVPPLWSLAAWALAPLMAFLQALATVPAASVYVATAPAWIAVAALAGSAVAMLPLPVAWRALGAVMVLPLLAPPVRHPAEGRFDVVAADVGQGSAILVRTRAHLLLFDTGPRFTPETDAGNRLLLPLLHARGERRLDLLVLSHRDEDHVGGARSLLDAIAVDRLLSSLEASHPLLAGPRAPPHARCASGQRWTWDGVRFEMLHPFADDPVRDDAKPNSVSCVLRVEDAQGRRVLLTGDLEAPQEARLVARLPREALRADVLLVPHHGSRTSSSDAFLEAVAPRLAVIQVGYRSRYGHPHPVVLARYAAHGIPVLRTDRCGAWVATAEGASCTREARRRYWQWSNDAPAPQPAATRLRPCCLAR